MGGGEGRGEGEGDEKEIKREKKGGMTGALSRFIIVLFSLEPFLLFRYFHHLVSVQ